MARYRICPGCGEFHEGGDARCPDCLVEVVQRADARRDRARRADGRTTSWWRRFRLTVIDRDGGCVHCAATTDLVVDKIAGGVHREGDSLDEYQTLCRRCSGRKDGGRPRRLTVSA